MILALDLGGTHQRIAIMQDDKILKKKDIDLKELIPQINQFLKECSEEGHETEICCISAAGPIENNKCKLTNTDFVIDADEIKKDTLLKEVILINDFTAIGYAISYIDFSHEYLTVLQEGDSFGNKGVIGPGTGMGVSYIIRNGDKYVISPSEAAHAGFPVMKGYEKLFNSIEGDVTMESLISGPGIERIMKYLLYNSPITKEDNDLKDANAIKISSSHNEKAQEAMQIFIELFGAAAQVVALHGMTTGGLFLGGGISTKNVELIKQGSFLEHFHKNKKMGDVLKKMPIYIINDYDISFYGCSIAIKYLKG